MEAGYQVAHIEDPSILEEFPMVVVEYFFASSTGSKTDREWRIEGQEHIAALLQSKYNEDTGEMDCSDISLGDDNRVYTERWKEVEVIAVIYPSVSQTYFSESLNHPHYSVHPTELDSFCSHVKAFQKLNNGYPLLRLCKGDSNHIIPGRLHVTNVLPRNVQKVMDMFPLSKIAKVVSELGVIHG
jgi:hypothetical protein